MLFHIEVNHNNDEEDELGELMELIKPRAHRWKSYTFSGSRFDVMQSYLEVAAPMLETKSGKESSSTLLEVPTSLVLNSVAPQPSRTAPSRTWQALFFTTSRRIL